MEVHHPYTAGHQIRVSVLAGAIAESLGWSTRDVHEVRVAGKLHDIGKVYIPAEILNKPGALSAAEFRQMQEHPVIAHDILMSVGMEGSIPDFVHQHHERLDGSGYPNRIGGGEFLVGSQIIAVADVVEAMSSERPYRITPGVDAALHEIERMSGVHYLPVVVDACLSVFEAGFSFDDA
jgi:putative nucleotidyltransferase with HDIG domain